MAILRERKVWRRNAPPSYKRPFDSPDLLKEYQQRNVRQAMDVLRIRTRTWAALADAMDPQEGRLPFGSEEAGKIVFALRQVF